MRLAFLLLLLYCPPAGAFVASSDPVPDWTADQSAHFADQGDGWQRVVDLRGTWQFRLGDNLAWSQGEDDGNWETAFVPATWEDEGFWGYDGFAWYRTTFRVSPGDAARPLYLHLGRVDDADEVWLNGRFLGSTGRIGLDYETGYHSVRIYRIPQEYLRTRGDNVIAVRVYDDELGGGIVEGQQGIYTTRDAPAFESDLVGGWRFQPGDDLRWAEPGFDDRGWAMITVPARWEPQGYPGLDGYAWYRRDFTLKDFDGERRVLLLGQVDDLDEVYVNGRRIGGTGRIDEGNVRGNEWDDARVYTMPGEVLQEGRNVVAVRVFDSYFDGGIYAGPVGVMRPEAYERWRGREGGGFVNWFRALLKGGWE
ncbi:MAG: beta galactosidase jelly roll domain-containing protein [Bacteroidota bacterium]